MSNRDVIIIHPPAVFDFRKNPLFTGALGASAEQVQFNKVPIGMLSLAEYLDRHGYNVIVDNLGDRMINSKLFDPLEHLQKLSAPVIAVGLHFQQHAQGALEVARLCKELHPGSLVVMGGLTATRFHEEIIRKYGFVDAVIRGEAEKPLLQFVRAYEKNGRITDTPNITYRTGEGEVRSTPLMPASTDLDDFEYTRFDLIEPKTSIYPENSPPRWSLAVCRGCIYNCAICGGSAYSYKTYMGMNKPAFRSPAKIITDIKKLNDQGVRFIGLYQDPRMGGRKYWRELLSGLVKEKAEIERLSLDLLVPADEEFIREVSKIGRQVVMHLCPDTGSDEVRRKLGRPYTNEELLRTIELCHKYRLPVTTFFSVGLAGETAADVKKTWEIWEKLTSMDRLSQTSGMLDVPLGGPIVGPIVLDPGSPAFDNPEKHGYKLLYTNLEEYIEGLSQPSWHQWLNYETDLLDNAALVDLILSTVGFSTEQRLKSGVYDQYQALAERIRTVLDREVVKEVDQIMTIENRTERDAALVALKNRHESFLNRPIDSFLR
jgi:B12-binding domain/radical SAM domain protein